MPDPDEFDQFLRRSLTAKSAPALSEEFDTRLTTQLQPRRMNRKARAILAGYSVAGLATSLGVLLATGQPWWLAVALILVPVGIVAIIIRPYFKPKGRSR